MHSRSTSSILRKPKIHDPAEWKRFAGDVYKINEDNLYGLSIDIRSVDLEKGDHLMFTGNIMEGVPNKPGHALWLSFFSLKKQAIIWISAGDFKENWFSLVSKLST